MSGFCVTTTMQSVRFLLNKWLPIYERAMAHEPLYTHKKPRTNWSRRDLTPEQKETIKTRLRNGERPKLVAREYDLAESTVRYYLTKL
jgi:DNA-binding NarL/FixJ family response regulator